MKNNLIRAVIIVAITSIGFSENLFAGKCLSKLFLAVEEVQEGDYVGAAGNFIEVLEDTVEMTRTLANVAEELQQEFKFTGEFSEGDLAHMLQELDKIAFIQKGGSYELYPGTPRAQNVKALSELIDYIVVAFKDGKITAEEEFQLLLKSHQASRILVDELSKNIKDHNVKRLVSIMHMVSQVAVNSFDPEKPLSVTSASLKKMVADNQVEISNFLASVIILIAPQAKESALEHYSDLLLSELYPSYHMLLADTEHMNALIDYAKTLKPLSWLFTDAAVSSPKVISAAPRLLEASEPSTGAASLVKFVPTSKNEGDLVDEGHPDLEFSQTLKSALLLASELSKHSPSDLTNLTKLTLTSGDVANIILTMDGIIYIHNGGTLGGYERTKIRFPIVNSAARLIDSIVISAMDSKITPEERAFIVKNALSFAEVLIEKIIEKTSSHVVLRNLVEPSMVIAQYVASAVREENTSFRDFLSDNAPVLVRLCAQLIKSYKLDSELRENFAPWIEGLTPLDNITNASDAIIKYPYQVQRLLRDARKIDRYRDKFQTPAASEASKNLSMSPSKTA